MSPSDQSRAGRSRRPARLSAVGNGLATVLVLIMMSLMLADVIGRELLNNPLTGATELIELCLVGCVFAALPVISWQEGHIVADLFDGLLRRRGMMLARILGCLIGAPVFALAAYQLHALAQRAVLFNDQTPQLGIKLWIVLAFMAAMSGLTALLLLLRAIHVARCPDTPADEVVK